MSKALNHLDRRTFLKGGLAAGTLAAASTLLAACAPAAPAADNPAASNTGEGATSGTSPVATGYANPDGIGIPVMPDATEDVDVVVMGSGMGGLTAAMLTKEQAPDATVVMLEKQSTLGGNTNFAEGGGGFLNMTPEEARAAVHE